MGKYTIGVDLGTTNTVACTFENSFEFIKSKRGSIIPSAVMFKDGKISVGEAARQRAIRSPQNVVTSSKTFMGDFSKKWDIEGQQFTPTDIAAEILKEVRAAAEKHFETTEQIEAVITVPAYFTASQYDETKKAAEKAGLKVLNIISEPVAAAIAYGFDDSVRNVFVIDLGGGTFDICLLETEKAGRDGKKFSTKYVDGDRQLGGDNFDQVLVDICYSRLRREYAIDLSSKSKSGLSADDYGQACQKIRQKAEQAKIALSDTTEADIEIANLCEKNGSPVNFKCTITRKEFEDSAIDYFNKIKRIIKRCIDGNNIDIHSIEKVIFVGGSSSIPMVRQIVTECFEQEPYADKDLSKLVAMGAALCASQKNTLVSTKLVIEDILSHSLGIEVAGLGDNQVYAPLLLKEQVYPITHTQTFYTVDDYQTEVAINVYEGECLDDLSQNTYYGGFELTNIKQGLAGIPIKVTFEINESRQLIVTALDEATGSKKSITIKKGEKPLEIKKEKKKPEKTFKPLTISVTSSGCDDIGAILKSMDIPYKPFSYQNFRCDILFVNCLTGDHVSPTGLRNFVSNGGCLYASCYADELVKEAFPGIFNTSRNGQVHTENVTVEDPELRSVVGNEISVYFNTVWARLYSAKDSTCILRSTQGQKLPIMVSLKYGQGQIFFTCFHNSVQASDKEKALLQLLVLRQIGMNQNMSMSEAGKALGIDIEKIKARLK